MGKMTKRSVTIAAAAVVAVGGAGAAYAAWNVDSSANVTVTAGSAAQVAVTATDVTGLVPGGKADLKVKLANPNEFNVELKQITGPTITVLSGGQGCTNSNHGISIASTLPTGIVLPAKMTEKSFDITNVVTMSNSSDTACQGATFKFAFTLRGESSTKTATPGL